MGLMHRHRPDGTLYLALREGMRFTGSHRIPEPCITWRAQANRVTRGMVGRPVLPGSEGPRASRDRGNLYVADTENHVVRRIELQTGIITTVLGTGQRGDGPGPIRFAARSPGRMACSWMRPGISVGDSGRTAFAS